MISSTAFYDVLLLNHSNDENTLNSYERDILQNIEQVFSDSYNLTNHIPILPSVFTELWHELNCEHTDFMAIADILKKDPILKAKLLSLVNSAYYKRTRKEITEIEKAIAMIGLETISAIFVTCIVKNAVALNPAHYQIFGKLVWQHILETAVLGQHFATEFGVDNRFLCYLMGLVHDMGKAVIFTSMSQQWHREIQLNHLGSCAFKKALTEKANELSLYVVEDWHLPSELVYAVGHYYEKDLQEPYSHVLQMANCVSECHLQIQANMRNLKDAHELLMGMGLDWEQSCASLEIVNSIPPI